jgi:hypothetical protein
MAGPALVKPHVQAIGARQAGWVAVKAVRPSAAMLAGMGSSWRAMVGGKRQERF